MPDGIIMVLVIAVLIIIFLAVFLTFVPLGLWITAIASGADWYAAAPHCPRAHRQALYPGNQGRAGRFHVRNGNAFAGWR